MERGALYLASGSSFVSKAEKSAESLKQHNPELPISIYSDREIQSSVFDEVIILDEPIRSPGDSILSDEHFPYNQNLYLDADTYVCGDISDVFDLLEKYDMAMAHNVGRAWWNKDIYNKHDLEMPNTYPEFNTGVIAYNRCSPVRDLFEEWNKCYLEIGGELNQPALRVASYQGDTRIATLPSEYNFMAHSVGYASGKVKIVHQGPSNRDLPSFAERVNIFTGRRVTTWEDVPCRVVPNSYESKKHFVKSMNRNKLNRLLKKARKRQADKGTVWTVRAALDKILFGRLRKNDR